MAETKVGLTVYLLKQDQVPAFEKWAGTVGPALDLRPGLDGRFIPFPADEEREAMWATEIRSILREPALLPEMKIAAPSGLLIVKRKPHTFLVSFGHAWMKLDDAWIERDFGRRIVLNSIQRDQLVEISVEQVFAKWHVARERSPQATSVEEFGVEWDRDLVGTLEGVLAEKKGLGTRIRGGTSVRVSRPLKELPGILDKFTPLFLSTKYNKEWPEIDNLTPVKDATLMARLEDELDADLKSGNGSKAIILFSPAHKGQDGPPPESYVFGRMSPSPAMIPYLTFDSWKNYLTSHGDAPSLTLAKSTPLHLLDDERNAVRRSTVFDCFCYERSYRGKQYVLSSGVWYEVTASFIEGVNRVLGEIPTPSLALMAWNGIEPEGDYNRRCARKTGCLHFDAKNLVYGGGQSKFEVCDFFHVKHKTLFFAKIASKSSGMSHLVEQVRRTSELLFGYDAAYRRQLQRVFITHHGGADVTWLEQRPKNGDLELCLVSLGRGLNELPFFARCSVAKAYRHLRDAGHTVTFAAV